MKFQEYRHHGNFVWVREDLKGKHDQFCLCYQCSKFHPNAPDNCEIAKQVYQLNVELGLVTPVWECPGFIQR